MTRTELQRSEPRTLPLPGRTVLRSGDLSITVHRRSALVCALFLIALLGAVTAALCLGDTYITFADTIATLTGTTGYDRTIEVLRLPRTVLAVAAGAALGIAGALIQSVARNPLASPDIIGVTAGAGLAATFALTAGLAYALLAPAALTGGLAAAALVLLAAARGSLSAPRFVLAGVAVAVLLKSGTQILLLAADAIDAQRAQIWLIGTLAGRGWTEAAFLGAFLLLALPALVWAQRALDTTDLDDPTATGIGVRVTRQRIALAVLGVVLASAAVAQVGAVEFVALAAPQIARRLARTSRPPLLASALTGAVLLVLADWIGRTAFGDYQMPAGVLTAALGGVYLIYLLLTKGTRNEKQTPGPWSRLRLRARAGRVRDL
ncbi:FecCD family ABC transporter permease [Glycomyces niveus]|uniref:Iron ABC transporter permease n=1 Tax=Glycomyces niveus TaxID=2820287 RepID=A0ABS3U3F2_9ACTN|nr:iron ABC transporter permease [Glycomyces sp. NEAU-S30]MBO3733265.1 iron ABC transporter permease [Glycomyces sp. NEAU-S30]